MIKRIISRIERDSNLSTSIRGDDKTFDVALFSAEFPPTSIHHFPAMHSEILCDSKSFTRNARVSSEEDTGDDAAGDSLSKYEDEDVTEKEGENPMAREGRIENNENEYYETPLFPQQEVKYTSFTRKLSRWGFTRICKGIETGAYSNKYFNRDKPVLCKQMSVRIKTSNSVPLVHDGVHSEQNKKMQEAINASDEIHSSGGTTDINITLSPEVSMRNQRIFPRQNQKMMETLNSYDKSQTLVNTDVNITPSSQSFANNRNMCSERNTKKQKIAISFDNAQASVDTTEMDTTASPDLYARNKSNLQKLIKLKKAGKRN